MSNFPNYSVCIDRPTTLEENQEISRLCRENDIKVWDDRNLNLFCWPLWMPEFRDIEFHIQKIYTEKEVSYSEFLSYITGEPEKELEVPELSDKELFRMAEIGKKSIGKIFEKILTKSAEEILKEISVIYKLINFTDVEEPFRGRLRQARKNLNKLTRTLKNFMEEYHNQFKQTR